MRLRIIVKFPSPTAADNSLIYHIRNFAEDLQRALGRDGIGHVENMDTAITSVSVIIESQRHLGSVSALVRTTLKRPNPSEGALIER